MSPAVRRRPGGVSGARPLPVLSVPFLALAQEEAEHAERFLGLPLWLWQLANLALFLGVLLYFVARPLAKAFRDRQIAVEERLKEARRQREESARLEADIRDRMSRLEQEVAEVRARGETDGEAERRALIERGSQESERVRREAGEEIARRLTDAKEELRRTAADLTASAATDLLRREISDEDRRRLLEESVERLGSSR